MDIQKGELFRNKVRINPLSPLTKVQLWYNFSRNIKSIKSYLLFGSTHRQVYGYSLVIRYTVPHVSWFILYFSVVFFNVFDVCDILRLFLFRLFTRTSSTLMVASISFLSHIQSDREVEKAFTYINVNLQCVRTTTYYKSSLTFREHFVLAVLQILSATPQKTQRQEEEEESTSW